MIQDGKIYQVPVLYNFIYWFDIDRVWNGIDQDGNP